MISFLRKQAPNLDTYRSVGSRYRWRQEIVASGQARVIVLGSFSKINPSVFVLKQHKALGFCSSAGSEQILSEVEGFVLKRKGGLRDER